MAFHSNKPGESARKTTLRAGEIALMLGHDFGPGIQLRPLSEGLESQAFAFSADGLDLIARVNRDDAGFAKDAFVFRHFAGAALPVPEILAISRHDGVVLCVSRQVPGITLQDVDARRLLYLVRPVATVLDAMAAADVTRIAGCGPFDARGQGAFEDWPGYVGAIADERRYAWQALGSPTDMTAIRPLLAAIAGLAADCPRRRGLVHGDFGSNNVLGDAGRITGVIDWSEAMVGDPLYDVANILFWRPWLVCMEEQARFFEESQPWRLREGRLLALYQLRIGLETIYQAARDGEEADLAWALARCETVAAGADLGC